MVEQQLTNHLIRQISTMDLREKPFPYFTIDGFLPEDTFSRLKSSFPLLPLEAEKTNSVYHNRGVSSLHTKSLGEASINKNQEVLMTLMECEPLWRSFISSLSSDEFLSALRRKLLYCLVPIRGFSALRPWGYLQSEEAPSAFNWNLTVGQSVEFLSIAAGGHVRPHTDARRKLITLLFYLPEKDWRGEWGGNTLFFRFKSKDAKKAWRQLPWSDKNHVPHDKLVEFYELAEVFTEGEYSPNRLVGFCRTDQSYHAVDTVNVGEGKRRNAISINFHVCRKR